MIEKLKINKKFKERLQISSSSQILTILFIFISLLFALPSVVHFLKIKSILKFDTYFKFLYTDSINIGTQTLLYIFLLLILSILYFVIIKKREELFPSVKKMFLWILVVSVIFILVLPFLSSDVFYYLGIGRLDGAYNQNPYYTNIKEFVEQGDNSQYLQKDSVLAKGYQNCWSDTTVVYGPVWTLICKVIAILSFGSINWGLLIFKIANLMVHLGNCYLLYKISNKKIFTLLYGINPFILIEGIACVHNDIFVVFFMLMTLYFLVKRKNLILSIVFLAIATAIKYFTIIMLPFIIIYYFRQEKPKKRFIRCIQYGCLFLIVMIIPYVFYIRDIQVLSGILTQQEKLSKSVYLIINEYFTEPRMDVNFVKTFLLEIFTIIYFFTCIILLNKKNIRFRDEMKKANYFIMAFLFLLITNFQPWYIMWLFPLLIWQNAKMILWIPQIALMSQFANSIFLTYGERWQNGIPFIFVFVVGSLGIALINQKVKMQKRINYLISKRRKEN